MTPVTRGGDNSLFAAAAPEVLKDANKYKGRYLVPIGQIVHEEPGGPTKESRDPELAEELWETSEKLLGEFGVTLT